MGPFPFVPSYSIVFQDSRVDGEAGVSASGGMFLKTLDSIYFSVRHGIPCRDAFCFLAGKAELELVDAPRKEV